MNLNEAITLIARETGWTLEYIRSQPVRYIQVLVYEITFERSLEVYQAAYNAAMIVCALVNSKSHHYKPEDIIGHSPERRTMEDPKLGQPPKVNNITLADGNEYLLAPLNINMLVDIEDRFGKAMDELFTPPIHAKVLRAMLFARIKHNWADITEEQVGELITDEVLLKIVEKLGV